MANHLNVFYFIVFGSLLFGIATATTPTTNTSTDSPTTHTSTDAPTTHTSTDALTPSSLATTEESEQTTSKPEPIVYEDCVEAQENTCNVINSVFNIKARTPDGYAPIQCGDNTFFPNCKGGGWTFIGGLNGGFPEPNTSFHSDAWTSKNTSYGFNPGFWSANVGEVCIELGVFGFHFPVHAPSLRSIFLAGKKLVDVNKTEIPGDVTDGCYEVGFNVGDPDFIQVRAGVVAVRNKTGCDSVAPVALGIGILYGGHPIITGNGHGELNEKTFASKDAIAIAVRWLPGEGPTGTSATSATGTTDGTTEPPTTQD